MIEHAELFLAYNPQPVYNYNLRRCIPIESQFDQPKTQNSRLLYINQYQHLIPLDLCQRILSKSPQLLRQLLTLCGLIQPIITVSPNRHIKSSIHQLFPLRSSRRPKLTEPPLRRVHDRRAQEPEYDRHQYFFIPGYTRHQLRSNRSRMHGYALDLRVRVVGSEGTRVDQIGEFALSVALSASTYYLIREMVILTRNETSLPRSLSAACAASRMSRRLSDGSSTPWTSAR